MGCGLSTLMCTAPEFTERFSTKSGGGLDGEGFERAQMAPSTVRIVCGSGRSRTADLRRVKAVS